MILRCPQNMTVKFLHPDPGQAVSDFLLGKARGGFFLLGLAQCWHPAVMSGDVFGIGSNIVDVRSLWFLWTFGL